MYMYYMGDWSLALHMYPELCRLDSGFHSNFLAVLVQSINFLLNVFLRSSKALLHVRLFAKSMSSNAAVKFHLFPFLCSTVFFLSQSVTIKNRNPDMTEPCLHVHVHVTPDLTSNHMTVKFLFHQLPLTCNFCTSL